MGLYWKQLKVQESKLKDFKVLKKNLSNHVKVQEFKVKFPLDKY